MINNNNFLRINKPKYNYAMDFFLVSKPKKISFQPLV